MTNNAKIKDIASYLAAGIDPKTKLPIRMTDPEDLRKEYRGCLEEMDKQDFINKGT